MRLNIVGIGLELSPAIVRHVRGCVGRLQPGPSRSIGSVTVRLSDINGDRGGEDMRCRMLIRFQGGREAVVEAVNRDLYRAIDEAWGRAREAVRRRLKKQRTLRREYANRRQERLLA